MPDRLHIIVTSGTREKLQMAAMTAAVAGVGGADVDVFVSMNALTYFRVVGASAAPCEGEVGRLLESKRAPEFLELFEQAVELAAVKIYPCSMAMDVLSLKPSDLAPYLEHPLGLTKFLSDIDGSHVLTF